MGLLIRRFWVRVPGCMHEGPGQNADQGLLGFGVNAVETDRLARAGSWTMFVDQILRQLAIGNDARQAQTHHASRLSGSRGASSGGLVTG
jgi:hypothetical protein